MDEKIFEQISLSLKPGGLIVFAARYSFLGKFLYQTKLEELEKFERLKLISSDSFFKYDKLGIAVGKFQKTPVKVYTYQKTEKDSVLGSRRAKTMRQDEIKALLSKGVMKMMEKQIVSKKLSEKIGGISVKAKNIQDFRGGA